MDDVHVFCKKSVDGGDSGLYISYADMQCTCQNCGGWEDGQRSCISLAVDPSDAGTVYVGTTAPKDGYLGSPGAIYKTKDGGRIWTKTNQGNDFDYTVVDIDIDPQNSNIIWAVTSSNGVGGWAGTLYRSEDRGKTWNNILTLDSEFTTVAVKPNDSNTVFTGSGYGIIKHCFDGNEWQPICPVIPENIGSCFVWDIAFDPQNPEALYAAWNWGKVSRRVLVAVWESSQTSEYILTDSQNNKFSPIDGQPEKDSDVEDTIQVRIGGEYLFIGQEKQIVVPVRGGIFYDSESSHGTVKDFYGIAVGSGIVYKKFILDIAYQVRWGRSVDTGNVIATSSADIMQHLLLGSIIVHF